MKTILFLLVLGGLLQGCASPKITHDDDKDPSDRQEHFFREREMRV